MSPIKDQLTHQPTLHFPPLETHYQLANAKRRGRLRRHVTQQPRDPALASRGAIQLPQPEGGARCAQTQPDLTMLSRLLKEHQAKQNERKELQGERSPIGPPGRGLASARSLGPGQPPKSRGGLRLAGDPSPGQGTGALVQTPFPCQPARVPSATPPSRRGDV